MKSSTSFRCIKLSPLKFFGLTEITANFFAVLHFFQEKSDVSKLSPASASLPPPLSLSPYLSAVLRSVISCRNSVSLLSLKSTRIYEEAKNTHRARSLCFYNFAFPRSVSNEQRYSFPLFASICHEQLEMFQGSVIYMYRRTISLQQYEG